MEFNYIEIAAAETTVKEATKTQIQELQDVQLALVGGGIGSIIFG